MRSPCHLVFHVRCCCAKNAQRSPIASSYSTQINSRQSTILNTNSLRSHLKFSPNVVLRALQIQRITGEGMEVRAFDSLLPSPIVQRHPCLLYFRPHGQPVPADLLYYMQEPGIGSSCSSNFTPYSRCHGRTTGFAWLIHFLRLFKERACVADFCFNLY
jgi:hypothetical protein